MPENNTINTSIGEMIYKHDKEHLREIRKM